MFKISSRDKTKRALLPAAWEAAEELEVHRLVDQFHRIPAAYKTPRVRAAAALELMRKVEAIHNRQRMLFNDLHRL